MISWRKGIFRAWVVFTVIWLGVAGWIHYGPSPPGPWDLFSDLPFPRSADECRAAKEREAKIDLPQCIENARIQNWRDKERLAWTVAPPALLLVLGLLISWMISGFRPSRPS